MSILRRFNVAAALPTRTAKGGAGDRGKTLHPVSQWTWTCLKDKGIQIETYGSTKAILSQKLDSILKSGDITMPTMVHIVKAMVFSVVMHGCESWPIKKSKYQKIVAFKLWHWRRQDPENPLDCKEIQPVNPKGNHLWIFIGRTDAEAEAPILWSPDVKRQLTVGGGGKTLMMGRIESKRRKKAPEDKLVR